MGPDLLPGGISRVWTGPIGLERCDPSARRPAGIRTWEGWLYLATVLDCFSRRVVGWAMADHLRTELPLRALEMALARRTPADTLIYHTDRGCPIHV